LFGYTKGHINQATAGGKGEMDDVSLELGNDLSVDENVKNVKHRHTQLINLIIG